MIVTHARGAAASGSNELRQRASGTLGPGNRSLTSGLGPLVAWGHKKGPGWAPFANSLLIEVGHRRDGLWTTCVVLQAVPTVMWQLDDSARGCPHHASWAWQTHGDSPLQGHMMPCGPSTVSMAVLQPQGWIPVPIVLWPAIGHTSFLRAPVSAPAATQAAGPLLGLCTTTVSGLGGVRALHGPQPSPLWGSHNSGGQSSAATWYSKCQPGFSSGSPAGPRDAVVGEFVSRALWL